MGLLKSAIIFTGGLIGFGTFSFIQLGSRAPAVCRRLGNQIGLLKLFTKELLGQIHPQSELTGVLDIYKQAEFASSAFQREFARDISEIKQNVRDKMPDEFYKDPFEKFQLQSDIPIEIGWKKKHITKRLLTSVWSPTFSQHAK